MEAGNYSSLGFFSGIKTSLPACLSRCWPHTTSLVRSFPFVIINGLLQVPWLLSINGAAHGKAGAQHLFHCSLELFCQALSAHLPCNVEDGLFGEITAVLDVLCFLPVTQWFFQGFDDQACGVWYHIHFCRAVLNRKTHRHSNAFPLTRALHDVITHLFG